jgi:hypothetical protein
VGSHFLRCLYALPCLDAYTTRVQAAQPYLRLSRAAVLRMLLDEGLSAEEG